MMPLTIRPTGLASPAHHQCEDWIVFADGKTVGRIYQDASAPAELRWFWTITVYVHPDAGIITSGKAPTLERAKQAFLRSWKRVPTFE